MEMCCLFLHPQPQQVTPMMTPLMTPSYHGQQQQQHQMTTPGHQMTTPAHQITTPQYQPTPRGAGTSFQHPGATPSRTPQHHMGMTPQHTPAPSTPVSSGSAPGPAAGSSSSRRPTTPRQSGSRSSRAGSRTPQQQKPTVTDWAKMAEMWAKQRNEPPPGSKGRSGSTPMEADASPAGDATPLFDER